MSATLVNTIVTRTLRRLHDPTSSRHSVTSVLDNLHKARNFLADEFGKIRESGFFEIESAEILLAANADELALPADVNGVGSIELVKNPVALGGTGLERRRLSKLQKNQLTDARNVMSTISSDVVPGYLLRRKIAGPRAVIVPRATVDRYFVVNYSQRFPTPFTDPPGGADTTGVDESLDELLELYAAINCAAEDEEDAGSWQKEFTAKLGQRINAVQGSEAEDDTEQVGSEWLDSVSGFEA